MTRGTWTPRGGILIWVVGCVGSGCGGDGCGARWKALLTFLWVPEHDQTRAHAVPCLDDQFQGVGAAWRVPKMWWRVPKISVANPGDEQEALVDADLDTLATAL